MRTSALVREPRKIKIQNKELTDMTNVSSTVFTKVRENTSIPNLLNLCCVEGFVKYGV